MKMYIFSVFDKAVSAFMQPFHVRAQGEALRSFTEAVNDPNKPFGKYAMDYSLMSHGEFDDSSGIFLCHDPVRVIGAHEVLNESAPEVVDLKNPLAQRRMPM